MPRDDPIEVARGVVGHGPYWSYPAPRARRRSRLRVLAFMSLAASHPSFRQTGRLTSVDGEGWTDGCSYNESV